MRKKRLIFVILNDSQSDHTGIEIDLGLKDESKVEHSQSHHTGIEISYNWLHGVVLVTHNRTILELKWI